MFATRAAATESNKSDALSYPDGVVDATSTAIASGTNRYLEYTMNGAQPGGLSVSSPVFNYRLRQRWWRQAGTRASGSTSAPAAA
jgi:hypothetical protein